MRLNVKIVLAVFLAGIFSIFTANLSSALADLVDDGKNLLLEEYDIYGADAKFSFAQTLNPNDDRANFWRALTICLTNSDLKAEFVNLSIFDESDKFIALDKKHEPFLFGDSVFGDSVVESIIIDNQDTTAGYSEQGSDWQTAAVEAAYADNCRRHCAGIGLNKAVWDFTITTAGEYNVFVWWPYFSDNATDAEFTIFYDGGSQTVIKNQREKGDMWIKLGKFHFSPGAQARVELSDNTFTGNVVADAAKLKFDDITLDADIIYASFYGLWIDKAHSNALGGSYKEIAAGSGGSCTWTLPIELSNRYNLFARWADLSDSAVNAVFEIRVNGSLITTIPVNQQDNNLEFVSLGFFEFQAGETNTVTLLQNSGGKVTTDGIKIVPVRDYPSIPEFQNIQTSTLTQIDQAIGYLDIVSSGFHDTVDLHATDDFGNPVITELDYGDVLVLKGIFNFYKSQLNCYASYNMDSIDGYEVGSRYSGMLSVNGLLNEFPDFYALAGGASSRLATAKLAFINSINCYFDAYNFITAETDDQQDDFVTFDSKYSEEAAGIMHPLLNKILSNLNGSTSYFRVIPDDLGFFDTDASYFNMRINMRSYFDNPTGLRSLLPRFDSGDNLIRSSAPDPTFGGILPDLKQEDFNGMARMGSRLYQPQLNWDANNLSVTLNWKTDTYADFVRHRIFRSTTDTVDETSAKVYESASKNTVTFCDTTVDPNQGVYYYRLYTYYSNGDKSASLIRRVITKIYVDIGNTSGNEDGSRQYPFSDLGDAISGHGAGGCKIIIAQGTYPESDTSLHMWNKNGLILEGGYEPGNWTRDIAANETIIDGTGQGGWSVVQFNKMNGCSIDGFTIRGGYMQEWACGIQVWRSSNIKISNCKIQNNNCGIGIREGSTVTIKNCSITQNTHDGVNSGSSNVTIEQCSIQENSTGMSLWSNSSFDVRDSQISDNTQRGIDTDSHGILFNNLITNNGFDGVRSAGANSLGMVTVENCTITGNCAGNMYSSGFMCYSTGGAFTPQVKDCIIANNSGYGINAQAGSQPVISYSDIYNNSTGNYSGSYTDGGGNISQNPIFAIGPSGNYYLSQISAGQVSNSSSVDSGSDTAASLGLDGLTTRTDKQADTGIVDMGYHYSPESIVTLEDIIVDNTDTNTSTVGTWNTNTIASGYYGTNYQYQSAGTGTKKFTWQPVLSVSGTYEVFARWTSGSNRATNAKYTVTNHTGSALPVEVNQRTNNGVWVSLGKYSFLSGGTAQVSLSNNANGYVIADAVKLVYINEHTDIIVDNTDANTSTIGTWTAGTITSGYYGINYQYQSAGTGTKKFTWKPVLSVSGTYEVFARWTSAPNRATNAKYTVTNHTGSALPVEVNQQINKGVWVSLGKYSFLSGGTAQVSLSNNANGYVIADAVKIILTD